MDIFAHGLWAAIVAKVVNNKKILERPFKIKWFAFWSVFPDLASFIVLVFWLSGGLMTGRINLFQTPHPTDMEPVAPSGFSIFRLTHFFYNFTHSLILASIVIFFVSLKKKRAAWPMLGWLLHVLIDIPTHSYKFFPTPAFWPLSSWKFDGWAWSAPSFMVLNYTVLFIAYFTYYKRWVKK